MSADMRIMALVSLMFYRLSCPVTSNTYMLRLHKSKQMLLFAELGLF